MMIILYTMHVHTYTLCMYTHIHYSYTLHYTLLYTHILYTYTLPTTHSSPRTRPAHAPRVRTGGKALAVPRKRGRNRCSLGSRDLYGYMYSV